MGCFTIALSFASLCSYAAPTAGQVFMGRCWSSRREVIARRICSVKFPAQILDHDESLLTANFAYYWLPELQLLFPYLACALGWTLPLVRTQEACWVSGSTEVNTRSALQILLSML